MRTELPTTRAKAYRLASTVAKDLGYAPWGTGARVLFAALVGEPMEGKSMKDVRINDLIRTLEDLCRKHGDIVVVCDTLTHSFPPDPAVRERGEKKVLVLNS